MKSTMLSYLLTLGTKRCILYCLFVFGGYKCENYVREFVSNVRFVNFRYTNLKDLFLSFPMVFFFFLSQSDIY